MMKQLQLSVNLPFSYYLDRDSASGAKMLRYPSPRMIETYIDALCAEMALWSDCEDVEINAVRFEGGYIHMMKKPSLVKLLDTIKTTFHIAEKCEWTAITCPGQYLSELKEVLDENHVRVVLDIPSFVSEEAEECFLPFGPAFLNVDLKAYNAVGIRTLQDVPGRTDEARRFAIAQIEKMKPGRVELITLGKSDAENEGKQLRAWLEENGYEKVDANAYALPEGKLLHKHDVSGMEEYIALGLSAYSQFDGFASQNTEDFKKYVTANGNPAYIYEETREL